MPAMTLLIRVYKDSQLNIIHGFLKTMLKGLNCGIQVFGTTPNGWVQVAVSGEDENVATQYLKEQVGLGPTDIADVTRFSTLKGRIVDLKKSRDELHVDIGVYTPNIVEAVVPLQHLQARLVDGRKIALKKCAELYGFCDNLPLSVKISGVDKETEWTEAELSQRQIAQCEDWRRSLLDRLIVLGVSLDEVNVALKRAGFGRDVASIESLGLFEHAVVCKLGTDAAGLIPRLGRNLRNAVFSIHSPKRIDAFLVSQSYF
jgi:hypothetical protein